MQVAHFCPSLLVLPLQLGHFGGSGFIVGASGFMVHLLFIEPGMM
jgi:hypothetical protein